jgi:hypothetical protein
VKAATVRAWNTSAGAVVYAVQRPDPSPRWFGFHERSAARGAQVPAMIRKMLAWSRRRRTASPRAHGRLVHPHDGRLPQDLRDALGKGVEFTEKPTERPYGIDCALRDPFGNRIRFNQLKV